MLLSEMLNKPKKETKQKTIHVIKARDLLGDAGECFTTLNGKTVYIRNNGKWYTAYGNKPLNHNFIIVTKACDKKCENCAYCLHDFSVGQSDCMNDEISQEEVQAHFTNGLSGCKYFLSNT